MRREILLGIDFGTTVLKICAFDARTGAMLAQTARRLKVRLFPHGGREQNLGVVDRTFREVVATLKDQLGRVWRDVAGIGLAAQAGSSIFADRTTGKAKTPMILWNDGRSQSHAARLAARFQKSFWRRHTLNDVPPDGLGRLLWLQETQPELFTEENLHIGAGEYLFFRLTGVWRQDAGNALQIGSYSAVRKCLSPALFNAIGLPLSLVAPLRWQHETASLSKKGARLLELPEGVPVAGPYFDQETGYLSALGVSERPLQCSLGTAWVGNFTLPDNTTGSSPFQLVVPAPVSDGRLVVQPLLTGNDAWDWGLNTFMDPDRDTALRMAGQCFKKSLVPPKGLVALPWLTLANPYIHEAYGAGAFVGIHPQTERADQLRALVAGMAFELARVLDAVRREGAIDAVVLGGGASKGPYYRKLIASLFSPLPVLWQVDEDLSAARGAIYAFNVRAARTKTRRIAPVPDSEHTAIQCAHDDYLAVFERFYASIHAGKPFRFRRRRK